MGEWGLNERERGREAQLPNGLGQTHGPVLQIHGLGQEIDSYRRLGNGNIIILCTPKGKY